MVTQALWKAMQDAHWDYSLHPVYSLSRLLMQCKCCVNTGWYPSGSTDKRKACSCSDGWKTYKRRADCTIGGVRVHKILLAQDHRNTWRVSSISGEWFSFLPPNSHFSVQCLCGLLPRAVPEGHTALKARQQRQLLLFITGSLNMESPFQRPDFQPKHNSSMGTFVKST